MLIKRMTKKKARERRHVERFLQALEEHRTWSIEDSERPDFILTDCGRRVGLEVSELYRDPGQGSSRQEGEALRQCICQEAQTQWEVEGHPPVEVLLSFRPHHRLRKADVKRLANELVALVASELPDIKRYTSIKQTLPPRLGFPEECRSVIISRLVPYRHSYWHPRETDWVPDLTVEDLQQTIEKKNETARSYQCNLPEYWLLLVWDISHLSSTFEIPERTRNGMYPSVFARIFLFEPNSRSIIELKGLSLPNPTMAPQPTQKSNSK